MFETVPNWSKFSSICVPNYFLLVDLCVKEGITNPCFLCWIKFNFSFSPICELCFMSEITKLVYKLKFKITRKYSYIETVYKKVQQINSIFISKGSNLQKVPNKDFVFLRWLFMWFLCVLVGKIYGVQKKVPKYSSYPNVI